MFRKKSPAFVFLVVVFISCFIPPTAQAQQLTLTQAIEEATSQSPELQRAESMTSSAHWKKIESYGAFLPTLGLSADYLFAKKYALLDVSFPGSANAVSIPQVIPTSYVALNAQIPIYNGSAANNRYKAASKFEKSADNEYHWARFKLERRVSLEFYRSIAAQILKEVAQQNVKALEDHLKDVNQFRRAGVSTNYDVLRVDVQVSESRSELMNAVDNVDVSRSRLAELLGRDDDTRQLSGELPVLKPELLSKVELTDLTARQDLTALGDRTEALADLHNASKAYLLPQIGLIGQYQYYNNRNDHALDTQAYRDAYNVGIMLNWNIFDGLVSISKEHQASEDRYQSERTMRLTVLKAKQDLSMWKRKYLYYCSVYQSRQGDIGKAKESVRLAKEGRRAGTRTNTDLLDAEAELYRAQAGSVNAQVGAVEALMNLELTTGQKLYQFN
jgi:outer membrane protein TolC